MIVAANRDEFYNRPTAPAHFWEDEPHILAGRDLSQMGTWLGITKEGRFAALTNYRDPAHMGAGEVSRGAIVHNYLAGNTASEQFLTSLHAERENYTGFNLLVGNPDELFYYNNIQGDIQKVSAGTHGLSNHLLNTPWPKITKGKKSLNNYVMSQDKVELNSLFTILMDDQIAPDETLPETGVGLDLERKLSPLFIKTADYGTRSSAIVLVDRNNQITFAERTYTAGILTKEQFFEFHMNYL